MTEPADIAALLHAHHTPPGAVLCHADAELTRLAWQDDAGVPVTVSLALGPGSVAARCFRQEPPTAVEMERAIDLVEDALMPLARVVPTGRGLWPAGALAAALPMVPGRLREDVEDLFQRLASVALGHPAAGVGLPQDRVFVAAVLLLRELMHHLGFASLAAQEGVP